MSRAVYTSLVIYCSAHFRLIKMFSYSAPWLVVNVQPSHERIAIDLEMRLRMVHRHDYGHSSCATARELGFAVSTVSTTVRKILFA
jgi:hypothetical protein